MITCPACQHEEFVGALFCSKCGAQLNYQEISPPKTMRYPPDARRTSPVAKSSEPFIPDAPVVEPPAAAPPSALKAAVVLRILDSGEILPLDSGSEFTLGRVSGNQPILPDLDLTPYQAYEGGVSRLHATIKITRDAVTVTDLGSANGTIVNGNKLPAHEPHPLSDGDYLTLGKFKTQISIKR